MNEDLLPTKVTIDQGNLIREVIKSWNEDLLNVDHLMQDNWVVKKNCGSDGSNKIKTKLACTKNSWRLLAMGVRT